MFCVCVCVLIVLELLRIYVSASSFYQWALLRWEGPLASGLTHSVSHVCDPHTWRHAVMDHSFSLQHDVSWYQCTAIQSPSTGPNQGFEYR